MKRNYIVGLLLSAGIGLGCAHAAVIDPGLKWVMDSYEQKTIQPACKLLLATNGETIRVIAKGDVAIIRKEVIRLGGMTGAVVNDKISARLPLSALREFCELPFVVRVEAERRYTALNDSSRVHNGADLVQLGLEPLEMPVDGSGVIVGVMDSGIDYQHEDFRDPENPNTSRILSLWDQTVEGDEGTWPSGFEYGHLYSNEDFNQALETSQPLAHQDVMGHGTHVSGTAAGNGSAIDCYKGMAPGADIVFVSMTLNCDDFSQYYDYLNSVASSVFDAAQHIYSVADAAGKPAVINASIGTHFSAHNGTLLSEEALDEMLASSNGRAFVASAGNDGQVNLHFHTDASVADSVWTRANCNYQLYGLGQTPLHVSYGLIETTDADDAFLSFGVESRDETDTFVLSQTTDWVSLNTLATFENGYLFDYSPAGGNGAAGKVYVEQIDDEATVFEMVTVFNDTVTFSPAANDLVGMDLLRYRMKGDLDIHLWDNLYQDISILPFTFPCEGPYVAFDHENCVVSPGSATKAITVAAYSNVRSILDTRGIQSVIDPEIVVGELAAFSSIGPRPDGVLKPEIAAPGHVVVSSFSQYMPSELRIAYGSVFVMGRRHITMSGTSMSSPAVAGCVALYLQVHPEATIEEIRQSVMDNARTDEFTGDVPNASWGYGKMDVATMLGIDRSGADEDLSTVPAKFELLGNYPNPFNPSTEIRFTLPEASQVSAKIYTIEGRQVGELVLDEFLAAGTHAIHFDGHGFASGIYFYQLKAGDKTLVGKMMLMK